MRQMSFFLTTNQFLAGTKDVTRRLGWANVKPGDVIMAVEKGQGLGKGGKVVKLGPIRVVSSNREELRVISQNEVSREGFPEMAPPEFVRMFCKHMRCTSRQIVTRIEFDRLESA